jgi:hypothetical protein
MGEFGWIVTLMVAGALFELLGLVTAVWEVRLDLQSIRDFITRPRTGEMSEVLPMFEEKAGGTSLGREQTVEERVARLEETIPRIQKELGDAKRDLPKEWRADLTNAQERIAKGLRDYQDALEKLVTHPNVKPRIVGAGLFFVGLSLSTWANVWSLARTP